MPTAEQYRAKAAEYAELVKTANNPNELRFTRGDASNPGAFVWFPAGADPVERIAGKAVDVFHMGGDYTASWLR